MLVVVSSRGRCQKDAPALRNATHFSNEVHNNTLYYTLGLAYTSTFILAIEVVRLRHRKSLRAGKESRAEKRGRSATSYYKGE